MPQAAQIESQMGNAFAVSHCAAAQDAARRIGMESKYLAALSARLKEYQSVLIYGAGGVAKNMLIFLNPCLDRKHTHIVVSQKEENERELAGYPVRQIDELIEIRNQAFVIVATMPEQAAVLKRNLDKLGFRNYMTAEELSEQLYREIWQEEIHENKIVFSNFIGAGFGGNEKYLALDLLERSQALDLVWIVKKEGMRFPAGIRQVRYGTYEHYRELGTARIWIDNQHKNFFTRKREGQCYIQTWHGGGPLKKIEFDGKNVSGSSLALCEMDSKLVDIMVSPSRFNSEVYRRAFHYEGEIMECGYPRNDIFWKDSGIRKEIEQLFGAEPGEMIALYAPTFRNFARREKDVLDLEGARNALEKRFGKKCRIFVRFHPRVAETEKDYPGIGGCADVTAYEDIQELMVAADVLITDYSSVMWDFSLSGKPVFLFHPDVDLYEEDRGYYLPFRKMPYVESFDNEDLCRKIESFNERGYRERVKAFVEEYGSFDKGTATKAVGDRIMSFLKQES